MNCMYALQAKIRICEAKATYIAMQGASILSATGGFSALKSVYGNVRHVKLCVQCQYCLHCESNHSFR